MTDLAKLDEIFNEQTIDDFELPKWWVEEAKAALTQLLLEARIEEIQFVLGNYIGKEKFNPTRDALNDRIAELKALGTNQ